jgi:hypothetical protein
MLMVLVATVAAGVNVPRNGSNDNNNDDDTRPSWQAQQK